MADTKVVTDPIAAGKQAAVLASQVRSQGGPGAERTNASALAGRVPSLTPEALKSKAAKEQSIRSLAFELYEHLDSVNGKLAVLVHQVSEYMVEYKPSKSEVQKLLMDVSEAHAISPPERYIQLGGKMEVLLPKSGKPAKPTKNYRPYASLIYKMSAWNIGHWDTTIVKRTNLPRDLITPETVKRLEAGVEFNGHRYHSVVDALSGQDGKPNGIRVVEREWQNILRPSVVPLDDLADEKYASELRKAGQAAAEFLNVYVRKNTDVGPRRDKAVIRENRNLFMGVVEAWCDAHLFSLTEKQMAEMCGKINSMTVAAAKEAKAKAEAEDDE
jgi:hypothetical protein